MINRDFVIALSKHFVTENPELVEKDLILQQLLVELTSDETFSKDYAFKGGTCLTKCYLGYYRFSEDLDFTYLKQDTFSGKSSNEIKRMVSQLIDRILTICEQIAERLDLDFKADKTNSMYVLYGGNERMLTLRLWFTSVILDMRTFIKLQINFAEVLCFPINTKEVHYQSDFFDDKIRALFPKDYLTYSRTIRLKTYDLREIASEKMRAILTRRGTKVRDYVDLYHLNPLIEGGFETLESVVEEKIKFATDLFSKYRNNLEGKVNLFSSELNIDWREERRMLLVGIDENEFRTFLRELYKLLMRLWQYGHSLPR